MSTDHAENFVSNEAIGKRFRIERERLGLTQRVLAERLDISQKTLIFYEGGETLPKLGKLILFAEIGADINFILAGQRSVPSSHVAQDAHTPAEELARFIAGLRLDQPTVDALKEMVLRFLAFGPEERARIQGYFDALSKKW